MRVAFVTEMWKPSINGVVTRISETIDSLLSQGHEVLVVAPRHDGDAAADADNPPGLTVARISSFSVPFIYGGEPWGWPLPRVTRAIARFEPDLVHLVTPAMLGLAGLAAAKRLRIPLVASFHTDLAAYAAFYHLGFMSPFVWWWLARIHNQAAVNLVTSSYSRSLVTTHGIRRVHLWQRGVDVARFSPAHRTVGSGGAVKGGTMSGGTVSGGAVSGGAVSSGAVSPGDAPASGRLPVALYVGRLAWEKGMHRLEALARSGVCELLVVGDGPDRERLEKVFRGSSARFVGPLTGAALAQAYANADLFVFSSTTETLGLVLLEALASGLPIVAAKSPASLELLSGSPVARLFPADQPAAAVVAASELIASAPREELSRQARAIAVGWDWDSATDGLLDCYRRVLAAQWVGAART